MRARTLGWIAVAITGLASIGCGPPVAPTEPEGKGEPPKKTSKAKPKSTTDFDPCEGADPVAKAYGGVLRKARCDQEMFLTMASVAGQLGVECAHCHQPKAGEPDKFDYPVMTPKKEIANWMSAHLMSALRQKDGEPMRCKSCHVDDNGKPLTKILGDPRDPVKAQEWMSLVMVNKFTKADGSKLRCNDCHVGNFTTDEWQSKVLLRSDQIPEHTVGEQSF